MDWTQNNKSILKTLACLVVVGACYGLTSLTHRVSRPSSLSPILPATTTILSRQEPLQAEPLVVTRIPVFVHVLATGTDKDTGQPTILSNGRVQTVADLDAAIQLFNIQATEAAGTDPRRIELVRVGIRTATSSEACPDPVSIITPHRVMNAINILFQTADNCIPMTSPAYYVRTDKEAFSHEMGHALGLKHAFYGNNVPGQAELLARIKDPTDPRSCYLLGDNTCDTPPDYGYRFLTSEGGIDDSRVVCSQAPFPNCVQTGPPCDPSDTIIDTKQGTTGTPVCVPLRKTEGRRTYDPGALGLVAKLDVNDALEAHGNNIMAYMDMMKFTHEQFLRMQNFTLWRMDRAKEVPLAEQRIMRGVESGPDDPFGTVGPAATVDSLWRLEEPLTRP